MRTRRAGSRIGVTGAAGFIGSHLVERLLADGHDVVGIDSFSPNYPRERKERNLASVADEQRFTLVEQDVSAPELANALRGCDVVVHMAALPGVRTDDHGWLQRANVAGTEGLIDSLRRAGVARIVLASSSSIYGASLGPVSEEQPPAPASFYGHTKLAAERACRRSGLETVILRYFTVYGERQRPDMAFSTFIDAALDERPAPLLSGGEHLRHFTYVGDVVDATAAALTAPAGAVYNVAGPSPTDVAGTVALIEGHLRRPVPVRWRAAYDGEVRSTHADLSRILRELGWSPRVTLSEGLRRQVEHVLAERGGGGLRADRRWSGARDVLDAPVAR